MSQQHVLHVRNRQWPLQQRVVVEINLAYRQIVGGTPVGVYLVEQFRRKCVGFHCLSSPIEAEFEDARDGPRDHELFIGVDDPHFDAPGFRRNHRRILRIALRV